MTVETTKDRGATVPPAAPPELLAARLEVERLRAALDNALGFQCCWQFVHGGPHSEACPRRLLSAPPPDLGPLKELVASATSPIDSDAEDLYDRRADIETGWKLRALASQRAAESVLAAYPFLGDPECE